MATGSPSSGSAPLPPGFTRLQDPPPAGVEVIRQSKPAAAVDVSTLPDEQQKELLAALEQIKTQMPALRAAERASAERAAEERKPDPPAPDPAANVAPPEVCPWCGFITKNDPIPVTDADRRMYSLYMLGLQPFQKTYPFLDNKLVIVLQAPSLGLEQAVTSQLMREMEDKRIPSYDVNLQNSYYMYRRQRLLLAASLRLCSPNINRGSRLPDPLSDEGRKLYVATPADNEVAIAEKAILTDGLPPALLTLLLKTLPRFQALLGRLTDTTSTDFTEETAGSN